MPAANRAQPLERNFNWKGGRSVASNGYVLIKVGTEHHLADVRGYAYEHRLVAERKTGRRLLPGEDVHGSCGQGCGFPPALAVFGLPAPPEVV